jgi:hypothetical protein
MNALLTEGGKRFWDDVEKEEESLDDCTAASHLVAASGELTDVTTRTRLAVTGRANNDHLFYRSAEEAKRRMEIARDRKPQLSIDELVARITEDATVGQLPGELSSAEEPEDALPAADEEAGRVDDSDEDALATAMSTLKQPAETEKGPEKPLTGPGGAITSATRRVL